MICSEKPRKLAAMLTDLWALAATIRAYRTLRQDVEESQSTTDYRGLLAEICDRLHLDPATVHHPLCGPRQPGQITVPSLC